ncbi:helix-turn-helix domain-containing protein [Streptomyces sp. NPDC053427]|uniref:helix-turn-helix domain-containing protein n=1 Tax=Streptomyces sp. NPDC053427 TaxID=3365701 RepID=UPI0037D47ACA
MDQLSFGRRLRALRRQKALSQAELGGTTLSASHISLLESGKRPPTDEVLVKLAARLGISAVELVGDTGVTVPQPPLDASMETSLLLHRARLALLTGDPQAALDRFTALSGDGSAAPALLAEALLGRAEALEALGQLAEAARLRQEWLDAFGTQQDDCVGRIEVVLGLLRCRRESGDLPEAARLAEEALRSAESLGLAETPAGLELAALVAELRWDVGQGAAAAELLGWAVAVTDRLPGRDDWARAYDAAADAARAAGRMGHAVALAQRSVDICRSGDGGCPLARLRVAATAVLLRHGSLPGDGSPRSLEPALRELRAWGSPADIAAAETAHAGLLLAAGDAARARDAARSALERVGPSWRRLRAHALLALGRAMWTLGEHGSAEHFEEAAAELTGLGADRQSAGAYLELAELYESDGDVRSALICYRRASAVAGLLPADGMAHQEERDGLRSS